MKLIVDELGMQGTDEIFQEITVGVHSRYVTAIRPHLYRHNSPSGSLRVEIRDLSGQLAKSSNTVAISSIDPGNDFFHGEIRFDIDFGFRAGESYRIYLVGVGYSFSEAAYIGWCRDFDLRKYPPSYTPKTDGMNSALLMELWDNRFSKEGFENEQDLDFQDGFSSATEPDQGIVTASALRCFVDDAAYVTFKGSAAANGDIYHNTTDNTVRAYLGGAWRELTDDFNIQTIAGAKTFSDNMIVNADLTVNGTTTTINTTNLDVTDKNITINDGGNDASSEGAGLTVERTGTDGSFVYEDALTSKFKLGALGSEVEVVTTSDSQTLTNKTIDADNSTITNLAHGAEVDNPSSGVHGVTGSVVGTTDAQVITGKDIDGGTASNTNRMTIPKDTTTNLDALTDKQGTIAYDTTLDEPVYNDGTGWSTFGAGGGGGLPNHSYVVYDGVTQTILNSVGVSSVVRTTTGTYTITWSTAMSDANYFSCGYCRGDAANNDLTFCEDFSFTKTTTTMGVETTEAGTGNKRNAIWYLQAWEF